MCVPCGSICARGAVWVGCFRLREEHRTLILDADRAFLSSTWSVSAAWLLWRPYVRAAEWLLHLPC